MDVDRIRRAYQEAERRRTERIRSRPGLVALDEWREALRSSDWLMTQFMQRRDLRWIHGCRVFHSDATGEVEIEVQTIRDDRRLSIPTRVNYTNVRVRCINAKP